MELQPLVVLDVPMCRRMGHLRARFGAILASDLRQGEKNNDSSISHHTISMVFFAHFIIAIATETAPPELERARFGPPTTLPEGFQPLVATPQPR